MEAVLDDIRKRKRVLIIGGVRVGECKYLDMGMEELERLEEFDGDGNVVMYDIGSGYLLGKLGLIRMVKSVKSKKKQI